MNLAQAAMLAPLAPLADALALSWSRSTARNNAGALEYGWVRGVGSAAFIAGVLVAGQSAGAWGLTSVLWLTAAGLFATALSTRFAPDLAGGRNSTARKRKLTDGDWLTLLREPVFVRMVLAAALVIGSHGMHDAFAIIRWSDAGISSAVSSMLWSESVGAEVLVFVLLGPWLLSLLGRSGALTLAAGAALVRWGVMAQTADVTILALIQPLHGHSRSHCFIWDVCASLLIPYPAVSRGWRRRFTEPLELAQQQRPTILSGWMFARWGPGGFWGMAFLCFLRFPSSGACALPFHISIDPEQFVLIGQDAAAVTNESHSQCVDPRTVATDARRTWRSKRIVVGCVGARSMDPVWWLMPLEGAPGRRAQSSWLLSVWHLSDGRCY